MTKKKYLTKLYIKIRVFIFSCTYTREILYLHTGVKTPCVGTRFPVCKYIFSKNKDNSLRISLLSLSIKEFPELPIISDDALKGILNVLAKHKALSAFPFPDEHLELYLQDGFPISILNRLWSQVFSQSSQKFLIAD